MDRFTNLAFSADPTSCTEGIHCPHCRPHPTSSAGARRAAKRKVASRRTARRLLNRLQEEV
jgi:hypothetical protein